MPLTFRRDLDSAADQLRHGLLGPPSDELPHARARTGMGMAVHRSRDAERGAVLDGSAEQVSSASRIVAFRIPAEVRIVCTDRSPTGSLIKSARRG